ncbi:MAG: LysM peptidoglycan-binding domain-containing protein [Gemmatimonadetes bacterium]|nr:LysM peptidoglycan-binding domain-containing protein [Gemmatimonadota bacterium]
MTTHGTKRGGTRGAVRYLIPFLLLPLIAACAGSAPSNTTDPYDVPAGEYLNPQQYQELSKDEALEYCRQLAAEIDILNDNAAMSNQMLPEIEAEISELEAKVAELGASNMELGTEVAALEAKLTQLRMLPTTYTVLPNDWLRKISAKTQIYNDEHQWRKLYNSNRDKITDPNLIFPGQVLKVPRADDGMAMGSTGSMENVVYASGSTWTVQGGETLRTIAEAVYGSRDQSYRLFEANLDQVTHPDFILPGMVLRIP